MCIHDANTKRTTGKNFMIKDTDSEILRQLDAGSFKDQKYSEEKIPFIEELINKVPEGKTLVIEIKCGKEILPYLKTTIKENGKKRNFNFIAFDLETITETKANFPDNQCYWLCSNALLLKKDLSSIPDRGLDGVSLSHSIIDVKVAESVRQLNLELYTWTVDEPDKAQPLISLGIKGITTNRPGWLREQLVK
jgi:glycerophosphoryl diester phosphodiesterase